MTLSDRHIRLLQADPDDFGTIKALLEQSGLYISSVTPQGSTYWIAELDGVPGGCIGLEHGQGVSLIRSMAVLPPLRSYGLGRALVHSALACAGARGDRAVYLFSLEAGDYWRRFGFVPIAATEVQAALPEAPQVRNGVLRGWIHEEQGWRRELLKVGTAK